MINYVLSKCGCAGNWKERFYVGAPKIASYSGSAREISQKLYKYKYIVLLMKNIVIIKNKYYTCENCGKTFNYFVNKQLHKWFVCNGYTQFSFIY